MKRIVLLGPPGSGKGTQGDMISQKYGWPRISTGDIFREAAEAGDERGLMIKATIDRGLLVDDHIVISLVKARIEREDCQHGYIWDGFPRTINQAEESLKWCKEGDQQLAFFIDITDQAILQRLTARRTCHECHSVFNGHNREYPKDGLCPKCRIPLIQRDDDKKEVISKRLEVYHSTTEPLLRYYKGMEYFYKVDGSGDPDTLFKKICDIIEAA
ncbi:MAG TPA: nucleoside monophosphate kinase [Candidatus Aminicenantes bacterium]|nr:nucleoside monophosphate kinase [Candidatus Aminicenantes bacterium]